MKFCLLLLLFCQAALAQTNPDIPDTATLTEKYLEELSKREIGQKKFAIKSSRYRYSTMSRANAPGAAAEAGGGREIQESDVYKIGKKSKKELFLLNQYRGFQVISFEEGLGSPKILGRYPIFNNWNSEMYYLEAQDKVIVLNTEYDYSPRQWQTNYSTVVYLIDVSNSAAPKIVTEERVSGYLQESRMVGDVLYTITNDGNWSQLKAMITSLKIGSEIESIDSAELHSESKWVRTMNVIKNAEKYYVVSTLSDWQNKGDLVNVHDITSAKGDIQKLFTAKARGQISERSETFIHKNHLFAVSNYQGTENSRLRVSVEAFPLLASNDIVTSKENMRLSVGDTNGLHANLQDVRVSGDLLYTFWVPANNMDPFDLFDISEPSKGLKHLGQLQFDGWISKAFPLEYNGRKFVLGLGWIVPTTAENGRRYPQAKLFEIKKEGTSYKHEVVASLTLDSADLWASLNDLDKYFEILDNGNGISNILFPVTFTKGWKSGAKIVNVDLNTSKITEGSSIVAEHSWLKRVFVNKEIQAINTFSDFSLATFDQESIANNEISKTVSVLELARNIVDFQVISPTVGLQIVTGDKAVELRSVSLEKADAEKRDVLSTLNIPGTYHWHKIKNKKLFVITSTNKVNNEVHQAPYYYSQEVFDFATLSVLDLTSLTLTSERIELKKDEDPNKYSYFQVQPVSFGSEDVLRLGEEFMKLTGTELQKINVEAGCQYFFTSDVALMAIGEELFAYNDFDLSVDGTFKSTYSMPFMKKVKLVGQDLSCSASVNVPGRPVLFKNGFFVASESRSYYRRGFDYSYFPMGGRYPYFSSSRTFSLKLLESQEVQISDILETDITSGVYKDGFLTYSSSDHRFDVWSLNEEGEFTSRPQYLPTAMDQNASIITLQTFNQRNFVFMKNKDKVDVLEIGKGKKISKVAVSSTFDTNEADGSAESIFAIESLSAGPDASRIYVSQGYYGISELFLK